MDAGAERERSYSPKTEDLQIKPSLEETQISRPVPDEPQTPRAVLEETQASRTFQEEAQVSRALQDKPQAFEVLLGGSKTPTSAKNSYVKVIADGSEDVIEFPTDSSGGLEIKTLADVFQGGYNIIFVVISHCFVYSTQQFHPNVQMLICIDRVRLNHQT